MADDYDLVSGLISKGRTTALRALLSERPELLSYKLHTGFSWLHVAIQYRKPSIIRLLVSKGMDVNAVDELGRSPLYFAIHEVCVLPAIQVLLSLGADPNHVLHGKSLLHEAMQVSPEQKLPVTQMLLAHGACLDALDAQGWTPLHTAAHFDAMACAMVLLARGCDPHARTQDGKTAVDIARESGHEAFAATVEAWSHADHASQTIAQIGSMPPDVQPLPEAPIPLASANPSNRTASPAQRASTPTGSPSDGSTP